MTGTTTIALGSAVTLGTTDASGTKWRIGQDGFTGWGSPDSSIEIIPKPRQAGAWAGDAFDRERIMLISGTITALTPTLLNTAIDLLKATVSTAPFVMTVTESGRARFVYARRQMATRTPKVTNRHAQFFVQLVAPDPRQFSAAVSGSTTEFATSGGLTVPFTAPFTIASTIAAGLVTLTNSGNEVGPVTARIDGPCRGPIITHVGSGAPQVFSLTGLNLVAGESLAIDMEKKTVLANGTASRSGSVTSRVWSGFDPGINTWAFTAVTPDASALLTITANPANK